MQAADFFMCWWLDDIFSWLQNQKPEKKQPKKSRWWRTPLQITLLASSLLRYSTHGSGFYRITHPCLSLSAFTSLEWLFQIFCSGFQKLGALNENPLPSTSYLPATPSMVPSSSYIPSSEAQPGWWSSSALSLCGVICNENIFQSPP